LRDSVPGSGRRLTRQLARMIDIAWFRPDIIVAIGRGGYLAARILSDYLGVFDLTGIKEQHGIEVSRRTLEDVPAFAAG